jgi:thiol-disulfide isomerase/thioredoxin
VPKSALALICACLATSAAAQDAAPLFAARLSGVDERPFALAALRGRPLVVNFWARWCAPCRKEIPELVKLDALYRSDGLTIVGIGLEDQAESVCDFARAYDIEYPILLAGDDGIPLLRALGDEAAALPYTLVIDRHGTVVARRLGIMDSAEMRAALARTLQDHTSTHLTEQQR